MSGFFLGGMADGLQAGAKIANDRNKTAIEQQAEARAQATAQNAQYEKLIGGTLTHINEIFKAQAEGGQKPDPNNPAITALLQSIEPLAEKVGRTPQQLSTMVGMMAARPPLEDEKSKKTIVTTSGGLGEPDRLHVFDTQDGTLTPMDPKTGQPMTAQQPAAPVAQPQLTQSDVIPPVQAQRVNAPQQAAPPPVPAEAGDAMAQANFGDRFVTPPTPLPPSNPNVNPDAIATLSPGAQELVRGVADGTVDPVKALSIKVGKNGQSERRQFLEKVKEYDPSFDMANYQARAATLKAFKSGVEARKVTALGTTVKHVTELYKVGQELDNWKSDTFGVLTKTANELRNKVLEHQQAPVIKKFDAAANAVANELETAFRQNNTAISGIHEWRRTISPTMSSDQIVESTKTLGSLLRARMSELEEQWTRGMGHNQDPSIAMKLQAVDGLLGKMAAGTLLSDKSVNRPNIQPLKEKYGLQ